MGIVNVTPDSFSDGGNYVDVKKAVAHALKMEREGADLIDLGGESTRPGAQPVSGKEELRRVLPVLEHLQRKIHIPISIDTSKSMVAEAALKAGAALVNDVTALSDPRMGNLIADWDVPVILMHMRGNPRTMRRYARYRRLIPEVLAELKNSIRTALHAGISRKRILIDPGLGFAKEPQHNFELLKNLPALKRLHCPVVIGPSRKSFLGMISGESPSDRTFGTAAAVALAVFLGADIVRVHDVAAMRQVADVSRAIREAA